MRQFSADYLEDTRRGLWTDREGLEPLELATREQILDVGCGTGALAAVLREESEASVVSLDADRSLLAQATGPVIQGDATRLPVADGVFDLVACQALLVNLPEPIVAVRELARVSSDLVAAIEPDNSAVRIESSVPAEADVAARARAAYLDGLGTDATLGAGTAEMFVTVGLRDVRTVRHELVREIRPPYDARDVEAVRRKATASRLADHETEFRAGGLSATDYQRLVQDWRRMGRTAAEQLQREEYHRIERVPFFVTVGRIRPPSP